MPVMGSIETGCETASEVLWMVQGREQQHVVYKAAALKRTVRLPGSTLSWLTAIVGPFEAAALIAPVAMDGDDTENLHKASTRIPLEWQQ